ncbi:CPBP family intramembrane glutamic endopeptidase [Halobacillus massiliensis]|uniref:CPBP family intramembrane glutamic endopeptidase n=1 Tax=Halobacillus massiliensis TaxID=1926286 RepID=UPI001FEA8887|nr:CPBP family intramembrane glutamic endopeptidase [Halobacillus massiliensis]
MSKRQEELIQKMSRKEITAHLVFTQVFLLSIAFLLSWFLFDSFAEKWLDLVTGISFSHWLLYGVLPGFLIVLIDLLLVYFLPRSFYDDGGINQKVFEGQTYPAIFWLTLLVAVCEEALFRGAVQTEFGFWTASILFALIHFRYLKKVVLLVSVLTVSFFIGYIFMITENLLVTITIHFLIDFSLAILIFSRKKESSIERV